MNEQTAAYYCDACEGHARQEISLLSQPALTVAESERLARSDYPTVRMALAADPKTSFDALNTLSRDRNHLVRLAVAGRSKLPEACIMNRLVCDSSPEVLHRLAIRQDLPQAHKLRLARDERIEVLRSVFENRCSVRVRSCLASNPAVPQDILAELAADDDYIVRSFAVRNPAMSAGAIRKAFSENPQQENLRYSCAENSNTPDDVLRQLADLRIRPLQARILQHENASTKTLLAALHNAPSAAKRELIRFREVDSAVVGQVSRSYNPDLQEAAARNPRISVNRLKALARCKSATVVHAVADNARTPVEALYLLAKSDMVTVHLAEILMKHPHADDRLLGLLAASSTLNIRMLAASHPLISSADLTLLAADQDSEVRAAAATALRKRKASGLDVQGTSD